MSDKPLISIVTISLQAEAVIAETIESVLTQTYQNIEYILKDGGSKNKTNEIIEKYKNKLQERSINTKHVISSDSGIYNAMNQALQYCEGEYIIFLNAGDTFFAVTVLDNIFSKVISNSVDIIYGDTNFIDENMNFLWKGDLTVIKDKCPFSHQSTFVRKEWMNQHKFDESLMITADYDFMYKSYMENANFLYVEQIVSCVQRGGLSGMRLVRDRREHHLVQLRYNEDEERRMSRRLKYLWTLASAFLQEIFFKIMPQSICTSLRHFNKKRKMKSI